MTFAVNQLPDRPRQIILMYYQQEYTMREIGERLRLDESRISQIHKGALQAMLQNLRMSGIQLCHGPLAEEWELKFPAGLDDMYYERQPVPVRP